MRSIVAIGLISLSVLLMGLSSSDPSLGLRKVNPHELRGMNGGGILPYTSNSLFTGSGVCMSCHGYDNEAIASRDAEGNDVNVVDDWRASMMANSAKDPLWQAKVSHEVAVNPQHQELTESICTKCHAPMGRFAAEFDGQEHYSIEEMVQDPLALDGVSCVTCHQQQAQNIGNNNSGNLSFETELISYGQYEDPWVEPMFNFTMYTPVYSEHISQSEVCATCHTLSTHTIDLEGEFNGDTFIEQATYHEWLNSSYNAQNTECQTCHMPVIDDPVILSIGWTSEPRSPYALHTFVGANSFMLKLLRSNITELGLTASSTQFADAISATDNMLQQNTLEVDLEALNRSEDTAFFRFSLTNLAGHKFPSGYPARRAFIKFTLTDEDGNELFSSGEWDDETALVDRDEPYEPHYEVINSPDQVQIYEMAFADVDGNLSTVLERAHTTLKDNRLPPIGFSTSHEVYDTTMIVGAALNDPDFNHDNGVEGSGGDVIYYNVPTGGYLGEVYATATVHYQSVPPEWLEEMFQYETEAIDRFRDMYENATQPPLTVKSATAFFNALSMEELPEIPAPKMFAYQGSLNLSGLRAHNIKVYDVSGRLVFAQDKLFGIQQLDCGNWPDIFVVVLTSDEAPSVSETIFNQ